MLSFEQLRQTPDHVLEARDLVSNPIEYCLRHALKEVTRLPGGQLDFDRLKADFDRCVEQDYRRTPLLDWAFNETTTKGGHVWLK
jgi:hypothetical protein